MSQEYKICGFWLYKTGRTRFPNHDKTRSPSESMGSRFGELKLYHIYIYCFWAHSVLLTTSYNNRLQQHLIIQCKTIESRMLTWSNVFQRNQVGGCASLECCSTLCAKSHVLALKPYCCVLDIMVYHLGQDAEHWCVHILIYLMHVPPVCSLLVWCPLCVFTFYLFCK